MVKAVIFDLDDTLISEKQYIDSGYHHIAKILSIRLNKPEEDLYTLLDELYNESSKNVFNRLYDKLGIFCSTDTIMKLVSEYRNHIPNIGFYDDVLPCLRTLKSRKIKVGIITDGYANAQKIKLSKVKAYDYFDEVIITDELGMEYWKPHPKAFEQMQDKLSIEFDEMVYVGDNPEKDFYISNIYPIKTIRIIRCGLYTESLYLNNIKEDYTIHSLNELNDLLIQ